MCIARLTDWEKSRVLIGPSYVSFARLCGNPARKDERLCEECCLRDIRGNSETQSRMLHGLLTSEPPKDSMIYGSGAFWKLVQEYEEPPEDWLEAAHKAHATGENLCRSLSLCPWLVQRPSPPSDKMVKAKAIEKEKVKVTPKGTILAAFPHIRTTYEESEKAPEKLETDTCTIKKEVYGDITVWISAAGHMFDCDTTGEPGEFMGMFIDGELRVVK